MLRDVNLNEVNFHGAGIFVSGLHHLTGIQQLRFANDNFDNGLVAFQKGNVGVLHVADDGSLHDPFLRSLDLFFVLKAGLKTSDFSLEFEAGKCGCQFDTLDLGNAKDNDRCVFKLHCVSFGKRYSFDLFSRLLLRLLRLLRLLNIIQQKLLNVR